MKINTPVKTTTHVMSNLNNPDLSVISERKISSSITWVKAKVPLTPAFSEPSSEKYLTFTGVIAAIFSWPNVLYLNKIVELIFFIKGKIVSLNCLVSAVYNSVFKGMLFLWEFYHCKWICVVHNCDFWMRKYFPIKSSDKIMHIIIIDSKEFIIFSFKVKVYIMI